MTIQELYFILLVNINAPPNHSVMGLGGSCTHKQHTARYGILFRVGVFQRTLGRRLMYQDLLYEP